MKIDVQHVPRKGEKWHFLFDFGIWDYFQCFTDLIGFWLSILENENKETHYHYLVSCNQVKSCNVTVAMSYVVLWQLVFCSSFCMSSPISQCRYTSIVLFARCFVTVFHPVVKIHSCLFLITFLPRPGLPTMVYLPLCDMHNMLEPCTYGKAQSTIV